MENYNEGEFHGLQKYYYENGMLEKEKNYIDGKPHGTQKYFNENGIYKKWKIIIKVNFMGLKNTYTVGKSFIKEKTLME